jgi:methanogenic corrinoid protein MtbC1
MDGEMREDILKRMAEVVVRFEEDKIDEICHEALDAGVDPNDAILLGLTAGMRRVGELYDAEEYGIPEVLLSSDVLNRGMEVLRPHVAESAERRNCRIIIGTVEGDIHSIGKNIVKLMLDVGGFEVVDLGEDVPPERFVEECRKNGCDVVALSTMMTTTLSNMKKTIDEVRAVFPDMLFIVGGASVTPQTAEKFGADGYAENATDAVRRVSEIAGN